MSLIKSGQIANCCQPNALITLKEYLTDYASPQTVENGLKVIKNEIEKVPNEKIRALAKKYIAEIEDGKRDFRF